MKSERSPSSLLALILAVASVSLVLAQPAAATVLFDNGESDGGAPCSYTEPFAQFEDFVLSEPVERIGFTWQSHDFAGEDYSYTRITILDGSLDADSLIATFDVVATRSPNEYPVMDLSGNLYYGYDYAIEGLGISLSGGMHWFGLTMFGVGDFDANWDTTVGTPETIPGSCAGMGGPLHLDELYCDGEPNFAFRVIPEPSTALLLLVGFMGLAIGGGRRRA